ncbi:unnamed protein product, partial [Effrenium voratum]
PLGSRGHGQSEPRRLVRLARMATRASMMQPVPDDLKVGARVQVLGKLMGTVKFVGSTKFAPGPWVGVELDCPEGKNDGTVQGERYFEAKVGHGIFARPNSVSVREEETPMAMPGEIPEEKKEEKAAAAEPEPAEPEAGTLWQRRHSIEADLSNDICVEERVDLMSILGGCADEMQHLSEAVDKLAESFGEAATSGEEVSPAGLQEAPYVALRVAWINKLAEEIERSIEEKLGAMLEEKLSTLVAP